MNLGQFTVKEKEKSSLSTWGFLISSARENLEETKPCHGPATGTCASGTQLQDEKKQLEDYPFLERILL